MTPRLAQTIRAHGWPERVLVVEGEPDFLAALSATQLLARDNLVVPPVIGFLSGSTPPPPHVAIVIATHPDPAGNRYAATLQQTRHLYPSPTTSTPQTPSVRLTPPSDLSDLSRQELCQLLASVIA
jgi:hypothetical protein